METSFEDQFTENDTRERRLPPHLHAEFYDKLKGLVVDILAIYIPENEDEDGTRRVARGGQKYAMEGETAGHGERKSFGSGVFINREGWILTCAHVIPKTTKRILFSFEHTRGKTTDDFYPVVLKGSSKKLDLAILQPRDPVAVNYAMLSPEQMFEVGMEVFTISHPRALNYTYASGQIMYPNYRLVGEVREKTELQYFDGQVRVIEINNMHCGPGSSGGPVFDSRGRVIGVFAFSGDDFNYAVHLSHIKSFWKILQRKLEKKRLRKGGDSSTSQSRPTKSLRLGGSNSTPSAEKGASKGSSTKSVGKAFGISKASYQNTQGMQNEDDSNNKTIFVGDLNDSVSDEQLRQFFNPYGQLVHVKILVGKRCGLVQFADSHCADVALEILNGTQLGGQNIRLSWGRSPSNKQVVSSKIIQNKQSSQQECYGPYGFVEFESHAIPSKAMSQSPTSEDMEESTQTKGIFSYYYEPAYGPVPPSEPSQDWQQMDVYDPMQGQALAGGYQGEWHDYQYADQLAYREQYLLQTNENYDEQTGLNIQLDPRLMTQEEKDQGLGSASKCDNQRLQQLRERDSWEKDPNFISDSYSECYPGYQEFNCEIVDSDDESNLLKMDMGGRRTLP